MKSEETFCFRSETWAEASAPEAFPGCGLRHQGASRCHLSARPRHAPATASAAPPAHYAFGMSLLVHSVRKVDADGHVDDFWLVADGLTITATGTGDGWRGHADRISAQSVVDGHGHWLTPGFLDLHGHGGGGHAFDDGPAEIRGGRRTVPLSPLGAILFFFSPQAAMASAARLATAVSDCESLQAAQDRLADLGIRTELAYEREMAAAA